jgi:hypothetical protein
MFLMALNPPLIAFNYDPPHCAAVSRIRPEARNQPEHVHHGTQRF